MYKIRIRHRGYYPPYLRPDLFKFMNIISAYPHLNRSLKKITLLKFLNYYKCFRCGFGEGLSEFINQPHSRLFRHCVDNKLTISGIRLLGVDIIVESRCASAHECGKMTDIRMLRKPAFDAVHNSISCLDSASLRHPDINYKLVALG